MEIKQDGVIAAEVIDKNIRGLVWGNKLKANAVEKASFSTVRRRSDSIYKTYLKYIN